ncbi:hypothetical protein X943_000524 [Babesia divergens]|uniref:Uncharacterized protein n=1 Tax=Babesia divergens TaxID=32595 RepID=A0AAD9G8T4_BABDI|nr:hypothetical protein X943_000524 [Babesia divergens]
MSTRDVRIGDIPWVPPTGPGIVNVSKMRSFRVLNLVAFITVTISLIVVFIPFEGLRVKRDIDRISINLNDGLIPYLVKLAPKKIDENHTALYLSTTFANQSIGDVTFGDKTVELPSYCKIRFVAVYIDTNAMKTPRFVNIYDFFVGAIKVAKYVRSDSNPEKYDNFDSSTYLIPLPVTSTIKLKAKVYELLYGDIEHVFRASFVGSNGKTLHEVFTSTNVEVEEIQIGQEKVVIPTSAKSIVLRAIESSAQNIIQIALFSSEGQEKLDGKDFYVHKDDWSKAYVNEAGLKDMLKEYNIAVKSENDLFTLNRIIISDGLTLPAQNIHEPSLLTSSHDEVVDGWTYKIFFGDLHHILGHLNINGASFNSSPAAVDRVVILYNKNDSKDPPQGFVCTKHDGNYLYEKIKP